MERHSSITSIEIGLRPARAEDEDFVVGVTEACMRRYAELTWGSWSEEMTRKSFRWETHQIVQFGEADIGCVELIAEPGRHRLNKLYIHPDHQRLGFAVTGENAERFFLAWRRANVYKLS